MDNTQAIRELNLDEIKHVSGGNCPYNDCPAAKDDCPNPA